MQWNPVRAQSRRLLEILQVQPRPPKAGMHPVMQQPLGEKCGLVAHGTGVLIQGVALPGSRCVTIGATVYEFDMKLVIEISAK